MTPVPILTHPSPAQQSGESAKDCHASASVLVDNFVVDVVACHRPSDLVLAKQFAVLEVAVNEIKIATVLDGAIEIDVAFFPEVVDVLWALLWEPSDMIPCVSYTDECYVLQADAENTVRLKHLHVAVAAHDPVPGQSLDRGLFFGAKLFRDVDGFGAGAFPHLPAL